MQSAVKDEKNVFAKYSGYKGLVCPIEYLPFTIKEEDRQAIEIVESGNVYSQKAIKKWLYAGLHRTDPLTGIELKNIPSESYENDLKVRGIFRKISALNDAAEQSALLIQAMEKHKNDFPLQARLDLEDAKEHFQVNDFPKESCCQFITRKICQFVTNPFVIWSVLIYGAVQWYHNSLLNENDFLNKSVLSLDEKIKNHDATILQLNRRIDSYTNCYTYLSNCEYSLSQAQLANNELQPALSYSQTQIVDLNTKYDSLISMSKENIDLNHELEFKLGEAVRSIKELNEALQFFKNLKVKQLTQHLEKNIDSKYNLNHLVKSLSNCEVDLELALEKTSSSFCIKNLVTCNEELSREQEQCDAKFKNVMASYGSEIEYVKQQIEFKNDACIREKEQLQKTYNKVYNRYLRTTSNKNEEECEQELAECKQAVSHQKAACWFNSPHMNRNIALDRNHFLSEERKRCPKALDELRNKYNGLKMAKKK